MTDQGSQRVFGLVSDPPLASEAGVQYGTLTPYFRDVIERAIAEGWVAYVFSPRDVLRQRQTVWGWTRAQGRWQRAFFATPQIAYPRFRTMDSAQYDVLEWLRVSCGTQFINQLEVEQMVADRWRLLQICLSHPVLSKRVPDSFLLRDRVSLETLLGTYPALTASPRLEHRTNRVAVLRRVDDEWVVDMEHQGIASTERFRSIVRLRVHLSDLFDETILQPHTEPMRLEGCPVGIRSFWQRGADARWHETASIVRVGQPGTLGSSLATAGLMSRFAPIFRSLLGRRFQSLDYQLRTTAQNIVELLDQRGHGAGELAIDFTVTHDGSILLRSASTLGGITALRRLADPSVRQVALRQTLGYATALYSQVFAPIS